MKPMPSASRTSALAAELAREPGLLIRILGLARRRRAALVRGLAASGDARAALALLPFALGARGALREQALDAVEALVRGAEPRALAALDARARAPARAGDAPPPRAIAAGDVEALEGRRTGALGVAALHRDGRVREAAVRRLAATREPLALAFLLLRANDWVTPVRAAARRALEARLEEGALEAFVPVLDLAFRLAAVRRNDLRPFVGALRAALVSPRGAAALRAGVGGGPRSVRRRCVALALEARHGDLQSLLRAALRDPDPVVSGLAAREVAGAFEGEALRDVAGEMLRSTAPGVRQAALALLSARSPADARSARERLLVDPHPRVRAAAAEGLRGEAGLDLADLRRRALSAPSRRPLAGAIAGLRDAGSPEDARALAPFLRDPRPRIRLAALRALARLDRDAHRDAALRALSDPSPRVSRAARDLLRQGPPVDGDHLLRAALGGRFPHERLAAVDLMRAHEHWTAGLLLLRVAAADRQDLAPRTEAALAGWHGRTHRVYAAPTVEQVAKYHVLAFALPAASGVGRSLRSLLPALETRMRAAGISPSAGGGTATGPA